MKTLDRYLLRELAFPVFFASFILVFLILIADLFDNIEDLLRYDTPWPVIFKYYASLVPYSFIQTVSWASWLGTLFLLVNLGFHHELIAMKAAGLKITTIVRPIVFFGFLIGIGSFVISDRIVPPTIKTATELREIHIEHKKETNEEKVFRNVTFYSGKDRLYFFRTFSKAKKEVAGVVILWFEESGKRSRQRVVAARGKYKEPAWEFEEVTEYQMDSQGRVLGEPRTYPKRVYEDITFTPSELASASSESAFLSYRDLKSSIHRLKENGVNVYSEAVDLQYRLAAPWQALVMMLVTIPLLGRTANRKLIALKVLLCVGLIFVFHVSGAVGLALGKAGKFFPFLSAWAGNIIFALGAILTLDRANY